MKLKYFQTYRSDLRFYNRVTLFGKVGIHWYEKQKNRGMQSHYWNDNFHYWNQKEAC